MRMNECWYSMHCIIVAAAVSFVAIGLQGRVSAAFTGSTNSQLLPHQQDEDLTRTSKINHIGSRRFGGVPFVMPTKSSLTTDATRSAVSALGATTEDSVATTHHVVLIGVGDLRIDDHVGLHTALSSAATNTNRKVIPMIVLNDDVLKNIPGVVAHTYDTIQMLYESIDDVVTTLQKESSSKDSIIQNPQIIYGNTFVDAIVMDVVANNNDDKVVFHACDLGVVDNELGYGAYAQVMKHNDNNVQIQTWSNQLRENTSTEDFLVNSLPDLYPEYEKQYMNDESIISPITTSFTTASPSSSSSDSVMKSNLFKSWDDISQDTLLQHANKLLQQNNGNDISNRKGTMETGVGLYGTHWGGLDSKTMRSTKVLSTFQQYVANEQSSTSNFFNSNEITRNINSLEHASMIWQQNNYSDDASSSTWLDDEEIIRYLSGPLLFGTISKRRIWKMTQTESNILSSFLNTSNNNPLRVLIEGREWHDLLGAKDIVTQQLTNSNNKSATAHANKYWRYHGFLCRYTETKFAGSQNESKEGLVLVHGFGASGTQWNKAMKCMGNTDDDDETKEQETCSFYEGLAPDLLGFGRSEKPGISYTGYLWDSQMLDFVKEISIYRNGWSTYVTGGNSIGGYTSMSLAACDSISSKESTNPSSSDIINDNVITSSGAAGTGRCTGLVLMNSAGPLLTRKEIDITVEESRSSVAEQTIQNDLSPCSSPPKFIGKTFGNALLWYLRPRIQSICVNLYPTNPSAVDDTLCTAILRDSLDPGAINVMVSGAKLPKPRTSNELLAADFGCGNTANIDNNSLSVAQGESSFAGPVLVAQGVLDPLNDAKDRLERFGSLRSGITMDPIQAGHCPHDEVPDQIAQSIKNWSVSRANASATLTMTTSNVASTK